MSRAVQRGQRDLPLPWWTPRLVTPLQRDSAIPDLARLAWAAPRGRRVCAAAAARGTCLRLDGRERRAGAADRRRVLNVASGRARDGVGPSRLDHDQAP